MSNEYTSLTAVPHLGNLANVRNASQAHQTISPMNSDRQITMTQQHVTASVNYNDGKSDVFNGYLQMQSQSNSEQTIAVGHRMSGE